MAYMERLGNSLLHCGCPKVRGRPTANVAIRLPPREAPNPLSMSLSGGYAKYVGGTSDAGADFGMRGMERRIHQPLVEVTVLVKAIESHILKKTY